MVKRVNDFSVYLDFPDLIPDYKKHITYVYSKNSGNKKLKNLLLASCKGYCVYCFTRILVDRKVFAHLEHAIEKDNCPEILETCIPNIAITCSVCNNSFKKKGQYMRAINEEEVKNFKTGLNCWKGCTKQCENYIKLRKIYAAKKHGRVILQPMGLTLNEHPLKIQYDIYTQTVIPSTAYQYNKDEIALIQDHIARFKLNDVHYKTHALLAVIDYVIENFQIPPKAVYDNLVADLFVEQLQKLHINDCIKLCENIKVFCKFKSCE